MTDEELAEKADNYIDECTKKSGFVILAGFIRAQFKDLFIAGYRIAEKDLSCVQQRLNMLEEHNMTIDDVITCLEKPNEIHSRQEPRAYYITKALNIAIDFLKNHRWHYVSKGELPEDDRLVLLCFKNGLPKLGYYDERCIEWRSNSGWVISNPYAWQYIEPPKEMKC